MAFVLALLAALVMVAPVLAAEIRTQNRIVVNTKRSKTALYVFGNVVTVDSSVEGDLVAFGSGVTVNGTLADEVRVGGQALAAGEDARIGDDLISDGASVETESGATVGGDLLYGPAGIPDRRRPHRREPRLGGAAADGYRPRRRGGSG